jgi:hypothetical protein
MAACLRDAQSLHAPDMHVPSMTTADGGEDNKQPIAIAIPDLASALAWAFIVLAVPHSHHVTPGSDSIVQDPHHSPPPPPLPSQSVFTKHGAFVGRRILAHHYTRPRPAIASASPKAVSARREARARRWT